MKRGVKNVNKKFEYLLEASKLSWEDADIIEETFGLKVLNNASVKDQSGTNSTNKDGTVSSVGLHSTQVQDLPEKLRQEKVTDLSTGCSQRKVDKTRTSGTSPCTSIENEKNKKHKCSLCQKHFKWKYDLTVHLRTHTGEKPHKCPQCEKRFSLKTNLKRHLFLHSDVKAFSCEICDKSFNQKGNLTLHRRIHTGDKLHECSQCDAKFNTSTRLNLHMRTHTGQKPFKCETCGKSFSQSNNLLSHLRTHSEDKPYICTFENCDKKFKRNCDLKVHSRVHTIEKPFYCFVCEKIFASHSGCATHVQRCLAQKTVNDLVSK